MGKVIRPFCWHQNLFPWGLSIPVPGYIHVWNHEKMCIKSDCENIFFLKLATNDRSDKTFLMTSKFCPLGMSALAPGLNTCIKSWKNMYKIRFQRDFFETCNKWAQSYGLSIYAKILVPRPCPGAIYMYKIMKMLIKSEGKDIFETCNQWSKWWHFCIYP